MNIVTDLRPRFGGVRDQGRRPTCLAMSTSDLHGFGHGIVLSAEYLSYYCVQRMTPPDPHVGLFVDHVSATLAAEGQPIESAWPYLLTLPSQPHAWKPPEFPGPIWRCDMRFRNAATAEVTNMVRNGEPLVLGLSLTMGFFTPDAHGRTTLELPRLISVGHR